MAKKQITADLEESLVDKVDRLAKEEQRSRSSMLRIILAEGVRHRRRPSRKRRAA